MNDQAYQDAKKIIENIASKVPQTWQGLVAEFQRAALVHIALGVIGIIVCALLSRFAIRFGTNKDIREESRIAVCVLVEMTVVFAGLFSLIAIFTNIDMFIAPNATAAQMLLGK